MSVGHIVIHVDVTVYRAVYTLYLTHTTFVHHHADVQLVFVATRRGNRLDSDHRALQRYEIVHGQVTGYTRYVVK